MCDMTNTTNFNNIIVHYDNGTQTEDNVNNLLAQEQNDFRGWECWAGIQNITIDNQGVVWRAICRVGKPLGNIYDGFDMPTDTITCTKARCTCAADIQLSKAKPDHIKRLRVGHDVI